MVLPDALIIGAQKAGTTTLFDMIGQHPDIYANPLAKDCEFFGFDREYNRGSKYYSSFFAKAKPGQIVLGGNATDLFMPKSVERINELLPQCKLIIILRDPVTRAFSAYRHALERGGEDRAFLTAIQEELSGIGYQDPYDVRRKSYVAQGRYAEQVERCLQLFSQEKLLVLLQEDLIQNPAQMMRNVFQFLGVNENCEVDVVRKNETLGGARFSPLNRILHDGRFRRRLGWERVRTFLPKSLRYALREGMIKFNRVPAEALKLESEAEALLRDHYRDDLVRLERLAGCRLVDWL